MVSTLLFSTFPLPSFCVHEEDLFLILLQPSRLCPLIVLLIYCPVYKSLYFRQCLDHAADAIPQTQPSYICKTPSSTSLGNPNFLPPAILTSLPLLPPSKTHPIYTLYLCHLSLVFVTYLLSPLDQTDATSSPGRSLQSIFTFAIFTFIIINRYFI